MHIKYCFLILINFAFLITRAQSACDFIRTVKTYQDSVKLKKFNNESCFIPEVDTSTFHIDNYMALFNHLKIVQGKKCHLMNHYTSDAGKPKLYVTDETFDEKNYIVQKEMQNNLLFDSIIEAKAIQFRKDGISEKEINDRIKRWETRKKSYTREDALLSFASDSINRVCNNLIPEDSSLSYLQYLFFYVMGEEFALYWHSYYGQKAIICNQYELEYYLNYYDKASQFELDAEPLLKLRNIDIEPIIELDSIQCTIEWYEILTHQSIFRRKYTIKRKPPYSVVKVEEQQIAEIKCHVFY